MALFSRKNLLVSRLRASLFGASLLLHSPFAWAQQSIDTPPPSAPPTRGVDSLRGFWERGEARFFAAATFDTGLVYLRPELTIGWGRPHYEYVGLEGGSSFSVAGATEFAAVRLSTTTLNVRVGARYVFSFNRSYLPIRNTYSIADQYVKWSEHSRYIMPEVEVSAAFPALWGRVFALAGGYLPSGVPDNLYVFEETLRFIVAPTSIFRGRLSYLHALNKADTFRLGVAAETLGNPERGIVLRTGPTFTATLSRHLEALGTCLLVVASPDDIGIAGADLGIFSLRYRWATGDPFAGFP